MSSAALNAERMRLLAERDNLNTPLLSKTQAQRETELALYTVAKAQFNKVPCGCERADGFSCAVIFCTRSATHHRAGLPWLLGLANGCLPLQDYGGEKSGLGAALYV